MTHAEFLEALAKARADLARLFASVRVTQALGDGYVLTTELLEYPAGPKLRWELKKGTVPVRPDDPSVPRAVASAYIELVNALREWQEASGPWPL